MGFEWISVVDLMRGAASFNSDMLLNGGLSKHACHDFGKKHVFGLDYNIGSKAYKQIADAAKVSKQLGKNKSKTKQNKLKWVQNKHKIH